MARSSGPARHAVEAADAHAHRVHGAAADERHEVAPACLSASPRSTMRRWSRAISMTLS